MARKNLCVAKQLNINSGLKILVDKLMKENGVLSGAFRAQAAPDALPATPVMPKVFAKTGIKPKIATEEDEQNNNKDETKEKKQNLLAQTSAKSPF